MKLRASNGCSGWRTTTCSRARAASGADGAVDDVEQLADGDRGRALEVRPLVVAGVGDDEPVRRRHQRVEQHLAVLGARVALADVRLVEQPVVAVARRPAREGRVVEPEQADDAVRHRAHRDERADRQVARCGSSRASAGRRGARRAGRAPRAARAACPARRRRSSPRRRRRRAPAAARRAARRRAGRSRRRRRRRRRSRPPTRRSAASRLERVERLLEPVDQLGEAPGEVDRAAVDVVEREHAREQPPLVLGHRHADEHAVQARAPRAGRQVAELERRAVLRVEAPADAGRGDPVLEPHEVVVVEPEAPPDRLAVGQVEHLRRGQPLVGQVEQARDRAEDRVGLAQRAVGEPDAQVRRHEVGRARVRLVLLHDRLAHAERGLDERRERLDVRAHDDHVARLERRVLGEQVQDRVAQHLDLARAPVAGVDLDAAVARVEHRAVVRAGSAAGRRARRPGCARAAIPPAARRDGGGRRARRPGRARAAARARRGPRRRAGGSRPASSSGPRAGGPRGGTAASRSHSAGEGCSRNRWTSRPAASARRIPRWPAGRRVRPKSESRGGRSSSPGSSRSRAHARSSRSAGPGVPIRARRRRHSSACQSPAEPPAAQARTSAGRCRA